LYKSGNNKALLDKKKSLSLEDFKETGDESLAWESFEKKLSAYSFLKYLVQENDIQQQLDTEALCQSETFCEEYSKFSKLWLLNLLSHLKLQLNKTRIFQCQFQKMKENSYDQLS
jgi:hypothetical protein